ncbi:PIN domain-containing protein [Mesorhizobium sp. M0895]
MRLLLDTNILSEVTRPAPDARVLEWLDKLDEDRSFISVVSIAEIRRGVALMGEVGSVRRWPNGLPETCLSVLEQRILPVDEPVALACAI